MRHRCWKVGKHGDEGGGVLLPLKGLNVRHYTCSNMLHTPLALTFITTINTLIDVISNAFAQHIVIFLVWDPIIEYTRQAPWNDLSFEGCGWAGWSSGLLIGSKVGRLFTNLPSCMTWIGLYYGGVIITVYFYFVFWNSRVSLNMKWIGFAWRHICSVLVLNGVFFFGLTFFSLLIQ